MKDPRKKTKKMKTILEKARLRIKIMKAEIKDISNKIKAYDFAKKGA